MDTLASVGQNEVLRTNAQRQVDAKLLQLQMQRSSNMQAPNNMLQTIDGHMIQVGSDGDASSVLNPAEDEESRKRRELLARRPSYRKIFNELSDPNTMAVPKIEDDDADSNDSLLSNDDLPVQTTGGMLHASGAGGLQTLTMTNASSANPVANNNATIVQYPQGNDAFYIQPGSLSYQLAPGGAAVAQGVVMTSGGQTEEASRKRELRLLKNREAARECRRKKKEYIKCLENRVALLENQNKTLIEELKSLKELYCRKENTS